MSKISLEEQIANALVDNAINDGFLISVNDAEEMAVNRSRNVPEITKAMFRTNMDTLTLNVEERRVGIITLIYGNGSKGIYVINHTDNPHINRLVEHTMERFAPRSSEGADDRIDYPEKQTGQGWRYFRKARKR